MRTIVFAFTAALFALAARADTIAITDAHIYTMGKAGEIRSGTVVVRNGRIAAVGANVRVPAGARVIDAAGAVVTPGIFVAGTNLGIVELDLVAQTNDSATKSKTVSAAFDVQYGVDPRSTAIPMARLGGVTHALVMPGYANAEDRELLFAGQAAIIGLGDGAKTVVRPRAAQILELGERGAARAGGARGSAIQALKADLDDVRWYLRHRGAYNRGSSRDLRLSTTDLAALVPVVQRRMPLVVVVRRASDILDVLKLAKQQKLRVVLAGAEEGWMVADDIAKAKVPVILQALANLPARFESIGSTMENAARLHAAGVTIAFSNGDDGHRIREVRYEAGNAVAHGLPYGAALAAITANPARIFGMGATTGTIEKGKAANIVLWSGDPLEPMTQAETVIIDGVEQPMNSRAHDLAERYRDLGGPMPPAYTR